MVHYLQTLEGETYLCFLGYTITYFLKKFLKEINVAYMFMQTALFLNMLIKTYTDF